MTQSKCICDVTIQFLLMGKLFNFIHDYKKGFELIKCINVELNLAYSGISNCLTAEAADILFSIRICDSFWGVYLRCQYYCYLLL